MIRRIVALVLKELRQHLLAGILLALLLALGLGAVLLGPLLGKTSTSILQAHVFFLWVFLPIGAAVLGNRLVVSEWHARTQLFVEALPIRRGEHLLVKYLLGLGLVVAMSLGSLAATAALAVRTEPVGERFLAIMAARTVDYSWAVWSFLFAMGLLGRLRIPMYLGIGLGLTAISSNTEVDVKHWGPFLLVDLESLPFERNAFPADALEVTALIAVAWLGLAVGLATLREGSVAESLAKRMSQREKVTFAVLFVVALIAIMTLDKRRAKKPYSFSDGAVVRGGGIEVLHGSEAMRGRAETLLAMLAKDLGDLRATLGWESLPPIRVAHRRELDSRTLETAHLAQNDGVLVRANLERCDSRALEALLVHHAIDSHTKGRARLERRHWVLDGFSRWWVDRHHAKRTAWYRALWATRTRPVTQQWLRAWELASEEVGEPIAEGVAYSGIACLEDEKGRDAVLALARRLFVRVPTNDLRDLLWERDHPLPSVFREAAGLELSEFLPRWNARLDASRVEERDLLEGIPEGTASLSISAREGDTRAVVGRFDFSRPPAAGTQLALLHTKLYPFDASFPPIYLRRIERASSTRDRYETFELAGVYGRGERAFVALEVDADALDCAIRLAAVRSTLP